MNVFISLVRKKFFFNILIISLISINLFAQEERKSIREGNKNYYSKNYDEAYKNFSKANEMLNNTAQKNEDKLKIQNNFGATNYRKNSFRNSIENYNNIIANTTDQKEKADAYYNIGNSYLQDGDYQKSIEAYKNALRNDPNHDPSRYNMAVATKAQEQQQSGNENKQQNQQQDNQKQKDEQNKQQEQQQDKQDKQKQPKEQEMNKEEMERYLESLQQKDKEVQEKVQKENAKTKPKKVEKNW